MSASEHLNSQQWAPTSKAQVFKGLHATYPDNADRIEAEGFKPTMKYNAGYGQMLGRGTYVSIDESGRKGQQELYSPHRSVLAVKVTMNNPLVMEGEPYVGRHVDTVHAAQETPSAPGVTAADITRKALIDAGYDGVVYREGNYNAHNMYGDQVVALHPEQVQMVGRHDPHDPLTYGSDASTRERRIREATNDLRSQITSTKRSR